MPDPTSPRLRRGTPVVHRSDHELQVGVGPTAVLVQTGGPGRSGLVALLRGLDGEHPLSRVAARCGVRLPLAHRVVRELDRAGLLAVTAPPLAGRTIKIIGAGRLGSRLVDLLRTAGPQTLLIADDDPADPVAHPRCRAGSSNAEALADRWIVPGRARAPGAPAIRVLTHWTKPDGVVPDLTVVATDAPECDRVITDTLVRDDQPHLLLRGWDDGVRVGPYVSPGAGSCVRCGDLHRRDRDPAWPRLLQQLSRAAGDPSATAVDWGAATAAAQVMAWAGGHHPEVWGATLELSAPDWQTRLRSWPPHPQCGCAGLTPQPTAGLGADRYRPRGTMDP